MIHTRDVLDVDSVWKVLRRHNYSDCCQSDFKATIDAILIQHGFEKRATLDLLHYCGGIDCNGATNLVCWVRITYNELARFGKGAEERDYISYYICTVCGRLTLERIENQESLENAFRWSMILPRF